MSTKCSGNGGECAANHQTPLKINVFLDVKTNAFCLNQTNREQQREGEKEICSTELFHDKRNDR